MQIRKLHYYSGILLTIFISLHLFNHLCSLVSIEKHIEVMNALRIVYRNVFVEILLFAAIILQITSGLKIYKQVRKKGSFFFDKLHVLSGLYLGFFFIFHVGAVLAGRYLFKLDTNFYFGAAGLNTFPHNLFFFPYYTLAILSFFSHIAAIHSKKMKKSILGFTPGQQGLFIIIKGVVITCLILYGFTNHFNGYTIPKAYEVILGK